MMWNVHIYLRGGNVIRLRSDVEPKLMTDAVPKRLVWRSPVGSEDLWIKWSKVIAVHWEPSRNRTRRANGSREIDDPCVAVSDEPSIHSPV